MSIENSNNINKETNDQNGSFINGDSIKTFGALTGALTLLGGLLHKYLFLNPHRVIIIATLCLFAVFVNNYRKIKDINWGQYLLLLFFNSIILFSSVTGSVELSTNEPFFATGKQETDDSLNMMDKLRNKFNQIQVAETQKENRNTVKFDAKDTTVTIPTYSDRSVDFTVNKTISDCWVYLGQKSTNKNIWMTKNFSWGDSFPRINTIIYASTDVYKRDAEAVEIDNSNDSWKLGNIIGVLKQNDSAFVMQLTDVDGEGNYWAKVKSKN